MSNFDLLNKAVLAADEPEAKRLAAATGLVHPNDIPKIISDFHQRQMSKSVHKNRSLRRSLDS